jgi:hypothetical protein
MENKTQQANLDDLLKLMNKANDTFAYEVWIPSLNRNVLFRELNTSQQKRLVKSIIDSPIYNTEFIFSLHKIIEENCAEPVDIEQFTILDKFFISLMIRSVSIGDIIELEFKSKDNKSYKRGISLTKIIEEAKGLIKLPDSISITDEKGIFNIECSMPTIKTEYELEKELRFGVKLQDIKSPEEIRETIGDTFIGELIKYVNSLSIKNGETITKIDFNTINYKNRISLLEKLPVKLVDKLIKYIDTIKVEIDKIMIVNTEVEGEKITQRLNFDPSFFIRS